MQLQPSPFVRELLSTLTYWSSRLSSSLRLSLDHSFSFSSSPSLPPSSSPSSPCETPASEYADPAYTHASQCILAPSHSFHLVLAKSLLLARDPSLLGDVVWLCKSLIPLIKPRYILILFIVVLILTVGLKGFWKERCDKV